MEWKTACYELDICRFAENERWKTNENPHSSTCSRTVGCRYQMKLNAGKNANIIRLSLDGDWVGVGVCHESWLNFRTDNLRFTTKIDIEIKYLWRRKAKNCFSITSFLYLSPPHRHTHAIRLNLSIRHRSFEWVRDGHIFACVDDWQWEWSMLQQQQRTHSRKYGDWWSVIWQWRDPCGLLLYHHLWYA